MRLTAFRCVSNAAAISLCFGAGLATAKAQSLPPQAPVTGTLSNTTPVSQLEPFRYPEEVEELIAKGVKSFNAGKLDDAILTLQYLLDQKLIPVRSPVTFYLAEAYAKKGDISRAIPLYRVVMYSPDTRKMDGGRHVSD